MKLTFNKSLRTSRPRALLLALSCLVLYISTSLPYTALANQAPQKKSSSPPPQKIDPGFQETQSLLQQGRFDEARQQIQIGLAKDPKSVEGFNLLGIVCVSQKDFPCALDAFQHALKLAPSSSKNSISQKKSSKKFLPQPLPTQKQITIWASPFCPQTGLPPRFLFSNASLPSPPNLNSI